MPALSNDLRYAWRALRQSPGFTLVAVLTLALGLGANTAIFSVVNAVLLRPLPFPEPEHLVVVNETHPERAGWETVSPHTLADWQARSRTIEEFGAWRDWHFTLKSDGHPEGVSSGIATPSFFHLLGATPILGRSFWPEDDQPGRNHVVLISEGLWKRRFAADRGIIGRELTLDDEKYAIIGVLPQSFTAPAFGWIDVWAPHTVDPDLKEGRALRNRMVWARLRPGATLEQARTEMRTIASQVAQEHPDTNAGWTASVTPLLEHEVGTSRPALLLFLGAVGCVLLIVCANLANLLLARITGRRRELAVRVALGAGRLRLARLVLFETLTVCLAGGAAGLLLAWWTRGAILALAPPGIPRLADVSLDGRVLAFAALISMVAAILLAVLPAAQAARVNVNEDLKEGGRGTSSRSRTGRVLVAGEVALAMALLAVAGLLVQSFVTRLRAAPGFRTEQLMTVMLFPGETKYPNRERVVDVYQRMAGEARALPGVESVAYASGGPYFGGRETVELLAEGQPQPKSGQFPSARYFNVSGDYFRTMGIALQQGRTFDEQDLGTAPPVAMVNESLAGRFWPGQNPIGRRLHLVRENAWVQVVGVVADVSTKPDQPADPEIYYPYTQQPRWALFLVVRSTADVILLVPALRARVWGIDPEVFIGRAKTLRELMAIPLRQPRFNMTTMAMFAAMALLLAAVGVYGVLSYYVTRRLHELGVRLALGAKPADLLWHVLRQGMAPVAIGVAAGIAAALGASRLLRSLLVGARGDDPAVLAAVGGVLLLVGLAACYFPARRAMKVDPVVALRYE